MNYALRLLCTVLMVASQKPAPTSEQLENRQQEKLQELRQARELADRYTEELLGLRSSE